MFQVRMHLGNITLLWSSEHSVEHIAYKHFVPPGLQRGAFAITSD